MSMRPSLVMTATLFSDERHRAPEKTVQSLLILSGSEEQQRVYETLGTWRQGGEERFSRKFSPIKFFIKQNLS